MMIMINETILKTLQSEFPTLTYKLTYIYIMYICTWNIIYLSLYHRANIHLHTIATDNGEERKAQRREKMEIEEEEVKKASRYLIMSWLAFAYIEKREK